MADKLNMDKLNQDLVGYKVNNHFYLIGPSWYLDCWFSIAVLSSKSSFTKKNLPHITRELYKGKLPVCDIPAAKNELQILKKRFMQIKAGDIASKMNLCTSCPDFVKFKKNQNLYNHFVTVDGKNLLDLTEKVMDKALEMNCDLLIHQMFKRPDMQLKANQTLKNID